MDAEWTTYDSQPTYVYVLAWHKRVDSRMVDDTNSKNLVCVCVLFNCCSNKSSIMKVGLNPNSHTHEPLWDKSKMDWMLHTPPPPKNAWYPYWFNTPTIGQIVTRKVLFGSHNHLVTTHVLCHAPYWSYTKTMRIPNPHATMSTKGRLWYHL